MKRNFNNNATDSSKPPRMRRSRTQLTIAYAPGALFTFEGGIGACISVAVQNEAAPTNNTTNGLIYEQIQEYVESWVARASSAVLGHPIDIRQTIDMGLVSGEALELGIDKFVFTDATRMGYIPFPLSFACRRCGLYRSCSDVNRAEEQASQFKFDCPTGAATCADDWEQIDVVFVHWSGAVDPLSPMTRMWTDDRGVVKLDRCLCGGTRFKLQRSGTSFSEWYFECVEQACRAHRRILQRDEFTLRLLGNGLKTGETQQTEVNMEPISYRASATYYAQTDNLLVFRESRWIDLLKRNGEKDLRQFLGDYFCFPGKDLTDLEKQELLRHQGREAEWVNYCELLAHLHSLETTPNVASSRLIAFRATIKKIESDWDRDAFSGRDRGSPALALQVAGRPELIRRYDPIRMAVEHRTLEAEKLHSTNTGVGGKRVCVSLTDLDEHLKPDGLTKAEDDAMREQIRRRLDLLGIEDMRLIRELEVCEYSFGFTRTWPNPTITRDKTGTAIDMPVRLNLFDRVGNPRRHPVFCINQANEAFYIRLKETIVLKWLEDNAMAVELGTPAIKLGGRLIESYPAFTRFLDEFRGEHTASREAYACVYTLLHTISHQLVGIISELSGLDLGSFGEHLFVPNLAFVVYRRGTTMDLGNLSSMWRNYGDITYGNLVLQRMTDPESLRCGSETVCMMRGGACPDCLLIPETACLTRNELLSRSVLTSNGTPKWDNSGIPLSKGFYRVAREHSIS